MGLSPGTFVQPWRSFGWHLKAPVRVEVSDGVMSVSWSVNEEIIKQGELLLKIRRGASQSFDSNVVFYRLLKKLTLIGFVCVCCVCVCTCTGV